MSRLNVGLTIYRSNHWIVRNVDFRGYRLDGVRIHGPVEGLEFQNCKFLYNGRAGIAAKGLTQAAVLDCGIHRQRESRRRQSQPYALGSTRVHS